MIIRILLLLITIFVLVWLRDNIRNWHGGEKSIGVIIGIIILCFLNFIAGLFIMVFSFLSMGGFGLIGLIFSTFGFLVFTRKLSLKLLFYGIVPATILFSIGIILIGSSSAPETHNLLPIHQIICIGSILLICLIDIYFFTRPKVKAFFSPP